MRTVVGTLVVSLLVAVSLSYGATRYVDVNSSTPTAPYTSWATAAREIHLAVDASAEGDTVLVNDGTYHLTEKVTFTNRVLQSVNGAEKTIIDNPLYIGVFASGTNAVIKGFSITGGRTNIIGCAVAFGATMDSCRVYDNQAESEFAAVAGVYVANARIHNTLIYSNTARAASPSSGATTLIGGVALYQESVMSNCQIYACGAVNNDTNGMFTIGGVMVRDSYVYDSDIRSNYATGKVSSAAGGLLYMHQCEVHSTTVRNNRAFSGYLGTNDVQLAGGVSGVGTNSGVDTLFENCMIVSNYAECTASGIDGDAVGGFRAVADTGHAFTNRLINSCVSYNSAKTIQQTEAMGGMNADYCMMTNVEVVGNSASMGSLAVCIGGVNSDIGSIVTDLRIEDNQAQATTVAIGGFVMVRAEISRCLVRNNTGTSDQIAIGGGTVGGNFRSSLVASNRATATVDAIGGLVSRAEIESCTIAGNIASGSVPIGGLDILYASVWNSVIYGNSGKKSGYPSDSKLIGDGENVAERMGGGTRFMSSCFPTVNTITNGSGSIQSDPQFIAASVGNYRLRASSPCRGAGVTQAWMSAGTDLVGLPRVFGGSLDLGAYEYVSVNNDFDGDGISDIGCYYALGGTWYIDKSTAGFWTGALGYMGTDPVTGDFDGDGLSDYGVYYPPVGQWNIEMSQTGPWSTQFGFDGTVPVTGDFDGDGTYDFGCYSAPNGDWFIYRSTSGFWHNQFGYSGTIPVTGDFDGDGICDFGCYYPPIGAWYIYKSKSQSLWVNNFGYEGTVPVTGDFDGDGICDFGCYYAPEGYWYIYKSSEGFWINKFGYTGTIAVTGDYDGDGTTDFGCYYPPTGDWYLYRSSAGFVNTKLGFEGTVPIGQ